ncbi:MAG: hypothetical protein R3C28_23720 [Pirellulaceae bacterium]
MLITDGLPTAHFEKNWLYMLYPPDPRTKATMRAMLCHRENITINMFLIPSWSQSEEDIRFAYKVAESTLTRCFFTAGKDLDRFVVWLSESGNEKSSVSGRTVARLTVRREVG